MKAYKIRFSRNKNYKEGMYILDTEDDILYTHNPTDSETGEPFFNSWTTDETAYLQDTEIDILVSEYWYPKKIGGNWGLIDGLRYDSKGNEIFTVERKHEIESIIDNALTEEDCTEWAAGNMTDNVSELVKKYNIKQLNIWDDVCEIAEFYPEPIKRESTWDYEEDCITTTVETIETWEYSDELGRYELTYLEEKETREYIPFNEDDYIRDGCVEIPQVSNS